MTRQEKINVKASRYLDRIIKITGALGGCWSDLVRYDTAEYQFLIYYGSVARIDKRTGEKLYTCVRALQKMPDQEKTASVLLLLHDNPKIFETWRRQAGYVNALADRYRNEARREGLSADSLRRG